MSTKKSSPRSAKLNHGAVKKSVAKKKPSEKNAANKKAIKKVVKQASAKAPAGKRDLKAVNLQVPEATRQTANQRKQVEAALRELIDRFAPAQIQLVRAVRKWLQNRLPTSHEIVYEYGDFFLISYSPSTHGYQGVLAIRGSAKSVQLYFNRGKELADPAKLLKGSANLVRYVDIDSTATLKMPEVVQLVEQAIVRNPVPFANEGQGTIVLSPSTAKKKK